MCRAGRAALPPYRLASPAAGPTQSRPPAPGNSLPGQKPATRPPAAAAEASQCAVRAGARLGSSATWAGTTPGAGAARYASAPPARRLALQAI
ncbi:MAG: hypothetical protein WKG07_34655 [Hymenobacter sp.]